MLYEPAAMIKIIHHLSGNKDEYVKRIAEVVDRRLADLDSLLTRMKQSGSVGELLSLIDSSDLVTREDVANAINLQLDDSALSEASNAKIMTRISKLTAFRLCERSRKIWFATERVSGWYSLSIKYLETLDGDKQTHMSGCISVHGYKQLISAAVDCIKSYVVNMCPLGLPTSQRGKNDVVIFNIPICVDHFSACEMLLTKLTYYGVLSMYPYCRIIAVPPGHTVTVSYITTVDESQLYDMFVAQINDAIHTYTSDIHPFARIFIITPSGHESQWLEIARGMLRELNAERLEKHIYFVPNVVNDVDAEKHRLAVSLVGGIETYASHAVMDRECPHNTNGAIINRFDPETDTDDSYTKDIANGAELYLKLAKPRPLWWVELQDAMKLYQHMSTIFYHFHDHIEYIHNVRFYTIGSVIHLS